MGRYEDAIVYFARTTSKINHYLISFTANYEALETVDNYPEKVTIKGPNGYLQEFDAESILKKLEKACSTGEVLEILEVKRMT